MSDVKNVKGGADFAREIFHSLKYARPTSSRNVHKKDLDAILKAEGYKRGDLIADVPRDILAEAQRISGKEAPDHRTIRRVLNRRVREIERAAKLNGEPGRLDSEEYKKLSKSAQAFVRFSNRYGDSTIDGHFF